MKQPDPRAFLFDIQAACQRISEFTLGMTFQDSVADLKTRSAVERQLEIIGEAVGQMLKAFPDLKGKLPEAPRIISFRNFLIHGTPRSQTRLSGESSRAVFPNWPPRSRGS